MERDDEAMWLLRVVRIGRVDVCLRTSVCVCVCELLLSLGSGTHTLSRRLSATALFRVGVELTPGEADLIGAEKGQ